MEINSILTAHWLDILFDNRNKDYGAYELRKTYEKRIGVALLSTAIFVALAIVLISITGYRGRNNLQPDSNGGIVIRTYIEPHLKEKLPEPKQKPQPAQVKPVVKTEIFTNPVIVKEKDLTKPVPPQADLKDATIGLVKTDGPPEIGIVNTSPGVIDGKGITDIKKTDSNETLTIVQVQAKYNGDWIKFLLKNLDPGVPVYNGAPAGRYTVVIQFVVDKEGNVSDIRPVSKVGYGMEEEAIRVLKRATKWEPAIQNGFKVKAYRQQPITFQVLDD